MGRREEQRERMRARLLDAALRLFAERGFDGTTIDQIAEEADVARQTVLNHYPLKRDFILAWGQARRDRLMQLSGGPSGDAPAATQLHRYLAALAQMNESERDLTRGLKEALAREVDQDHRWPIPEAVLETIRRGQERGELAADADPGLAAQVVTALYTDTLRRWLLSEPPFDLAKALASKLDIVLSGLSAH